MMIDGARLGRVPGTWLVSVGSTTRCSHFLTTCVTLYPSWQDTSSIRKGPHKNPRQRRSAYMVGRHALEGNILLSTASENAPRDQVLIHNVRKNEWPDIWERVLVGVSEILPKDSWELGVLIRGSHKNLQGLKLKGIWSPLPTKRLAKFQQKL